ncbi:PA14 domain-containing protein [Microbulbifer variabilis]|uniref:PA14 domain-containing protein n=1 Tax=Microbulbifer variabilis TaxID=266805 RepID=UPI001CFC4AD9|nr:PA14 domain-containing protein [Microbulbifer variabilis]
MNKRRKPFKKLQLWHLITLFTACLFVKAYGFSLASEANYCSVHLAECGVIRGESGETVDCGSCSNGESCMANRCETTCSLDQTGKGSFNSLFAYVPSQITNTDLSGNGHLVQTTYTGIQPDDGDDFPFISRTDMTAKAIALDFGNSSAGLPLTVSFKYIPSQALQTNTLISSSSLTVIERQGIITTQLHGDDDIEIINSESISKTYSCNQVTAVIDLDMVTTYFNGNVIQHNVDASGVDTLTGVMNIGPYTGKIWDLRVFNRALSPDEANLLGEDCDDSGSRETPFEGYPNYLCSVYQCIWWPNDVETSDASLQYQVNAHDMTWEHNVLATGMHIHGNLCGEYEKPRDLQLTEAYRNSWVNNFNKDNPWNNYVLHENFHSYQTRAGGGSKMLQESTANWGAYSQKPGHDGVNLLGMYTLQPHQPLHTDQSSPLEEGIIDAYKGGHQYGAGIYEFYLSEYVTDRKFIGDIYNDDRRYSAPIAAMYDLVAQAGYDMREVFSEFAARTITWDYPEYGEQWRQAEVDSYGRMVSQQPDDLPDEEVDNKISEFYGVEGTNGQWVAVPERYRPGSWAYNAYEVEVSRDETYLIGVRPSVTNPEYAEFRAQAVVYNEDSKERRYHPIPVVSAGEESTVTVPVSSGETLYLVVASTPSQKFTDWDAYRYDYLIEAGATDGNDNNGLNWAYYEGQWDQLPDFTQLTPVATGTSTNIDISQRNRNDFFGFRFEGEIQIDTAGTYTFYTNSDDGSRLYIDGQMVVDNDGEHPAQERSGQIELSAGRHALVVNFFEHGGNEVLEVSIEGPNINKTPLPDDIVYSGTGSGGSGDTSGVLYEYFEGSWNSLPDFSQLTAVKSGTTANFDISPRDRDDEFGFRFEGEIQIDTAGSYTFYTNSDDGSRLIIDGQTVVENDGVHAPRENSGQVDLTSGRHSIVVEFFELHGGEVLGVSLEGPGIDKMAIPNTLLFTGEDGGGGGSDNTAPVADDLMVTVNQNSSINITLTASDADDDTLAYSVVNPPSHGALSGQAPDLVYSPANGYSGNDSFTYIANDGTEDSEPATVSITVNPVGSVTPAKLYLMAGQSNMVGHGSNSALEIIDPALNTARDDVFIKAIISPNKALGALQPGYGYGNGNFGVELKMGHVLGDVLDEEIAMFKAAQGGTTLDNPDHWRPLAYGGNEGNLYDQMITGFDAFRSNELADIDHELAGFIWFQGYNDTFGTEDNYENHLRNLLTSIRNDLGQSDLPVIIVQINDNRGAAGEVVMEAQRVVAEEDPNASLVISSDLRPYYHYGDDSYVVIGERIAQAALPQLGRPAAIGDEYTAAPDNTLNVDQSQGVLHNDSGDGLSAELISTTQYGNLSLNGDGSFTYTPDADYFGPDQFEYRVQANGLAGNTTKVKLWVRDENDPLTLHYTFDNYSENSTTDDASGIKARVIGDGVSFGQAGYEGSAAYFNGEGVLHYWETYPIVDFLNLHTSQDFSFAIWVKTDTSVTEEQILISNKYYYGRNGGFAFTTSSNGSIKALISAQDHDNHSYNTVRVEATQGVIDDGNWHHVAMVADFSSEQLTLYVDGEVVGQGDLSTLVGEINQYESAIGDGSGGGDGSSQGFQGYLDDLRIYRKALTAQEVAQLADVEDGGNDDGNGLNYAYYEGSWNELPDFTQLTPVATGTTANIDMTLRQRDDLFGFRYEGYIQIDTAGTYRFYTRSDDGSRLIINDQEVVSNDGIHGPADRFGDINLGAGRHHIVIEFFEYYGGELLEMSYEGPGITKVAIPDNVLFLTDDSSSGTVSDGTYVIVNAASDRCADVTGASNSNGADIIQWDCHGNNNQRWQVTQVSDGLYTLTVLHSNKLMTVEAANDAEGANVYQWEAIDDNSQRFYLEHQGNGSYRIRPAHSNLCIETASIANRESLYQGACDASDGEYWVFESD